MSTEATVLRGSKPLITAGAMVAGLMAFLDISIVNVALNDIRANFGTPLDQIAWVSTAYAMANITVTSDPPIAPPVIPDGYKEAKQRGLKTSAATSAPATPAGQAGEHLRDVHAD